MSTTLLWTTRLRTTTISSTSQSRSTSALPFLLPVGFSTSVSSSSSLSPSLLCSLHTPLSLMCTAATPRISFSTRLEATPSPIPPPLTPYPFPKHSLWGCYRTGPSPPSYSPIFILLDPLAHLRMDRTLGLLSGTHDLVLGIITTYLRIPSTAPPPLHIVYLTSCIPRSSLVLWTRHLTPPFAHVPLYLRVLYMPSQH